jgi:3-(3-hydroxy-phenyl)propionate hydroxylase
MAPPSPAFALMRAAALGLATADPYFASLVDPRQSSAITFADSPLNAADSDALPAGPAPGAVLAECPLEDGRGRAYLTARLGLGYTLLALTDRDPRPGLDGLPLATVWIAPGRVPGADAWDATGRLFPLYGASPAAFYLVRPDGHVAGRWATLKPDPLRAALARALD